MKHKMQNPVIPGFYPDPSICRVGDDFYLACSSFELTPGIPIFHSRDLVHWEQIANVMTSENGFHVAKGSMVGGVMAPTIRYHDGTFYILNSNFSHKGNYFVTARDPAGPWSEPIWLDDIPGIDASIFFDHDGSAYIMGTGNVWDNGAGRKERGIWLARYDIDNFHMAGEPVTIFNSALRVGSSPEAPHLYHIGEYYYLVIAEGGTEHYHAVMVARSKELFGFYEGNPANPVMTHRHMGFKCPITNIGHADLVDLPDGSWYAVMLGSRLIDGKCKNLGRETFICPVVWERDWPLFSPETGKMEWEYDAPACLPWTEYEMPAALNHFDSGELDLRWVTWGTPYEEFYQVADSKLTLKCLRQTLVEPMRPMRFDGVVEKYYASFLARRQCAIDTTVTCQMSFMPRGRESAGLAVVQALNHQLHVERCRRDGVQVVQAIQYTSDYNVLPFLPGFSSTDHQSVLGEAAYPAEDIILQIEMVGERFTIRYGKSRDDLKVLCSADGAGIAPPKLGCLSGTLIGMYASGNGTDTDNQAGFDWFELK